MGVKDKADIYEGLLEKNAVYTKSGAGQFFTACKRGWKVFGR